MKPSLLAAATVAALCFQLANDATGQGRSRRVEAPEVRVFRGSPVQRLQAAMEASTDPDPLLPILVHTIERGLSHAEPRGELDRLFDRIAGPRLEETRGQLARFVADYHAVPEAVRAKATPANLMRLDPARVLDVRDAAASLAGREASRTGGTGLGVRSAPRTADVPAQAMLEALTLVPPGPAVRGAAVERAELPVAVALRTAWILSHSRRGSALRPPEIAELYKRTPMPPGPPGAAGAPAVVSPELLDHLYAVLAAPHIDHLEPAAPPAGYDSGKEMTLEIVGARFAGNPSDNNIVIETELSNGKNAPLGSPIPALSVSGDGTVLSAKIPPLNAGHYWIAAQSKAADQKMHESNLYGLDIASPPPRIDGISPPAPGATNFQYPGKGITINVSNLRPSGGNSVWVWFDPKPGTLRTTPGPYPWLDYLAAGQVVNAAQVSVTIPKRLAPGEYDVKVLNSDGPWSLGWAYTIRPYKFKVAFTELRCNHARMSNYPVILVKQPFFPPNDAIITTWSVVREGVPNGPNTYAKSTKMLNATSNKVTAYGSEGFLFDCSADAKNCPAGDVHSFIGVGTQLIQVSGNLDDGEAIKSDIQTLNTIIDVGSGIAGLLGQEEIAAIAQAAKPVIDKIIGWLNSHDGPVFLNFGGLHGDEWTVPQLQTLSVGQLHSGCFHRCAAGPGYTPSEGTCPYGAGGSPCGQSGTPYDYEVWYTIEAVEWP